jgi:hypothetical protein
MIEETKDIFDKLNSAMIRTMNELDVKPSSYIDPCEAPFLFGFLVAVCAKVQQESLKRTPQNGISIRFQTPPSNPVVSHRMLIEAVTPHRNKIAKYSPESNKLTEQIDGVLGDLPERFSERDKLLYLRGKMAGERMYSDIRSKREQLKKEKGLSDKELSDLMDEQEDCEQSA